MGYAAATGNERNAADGCSKPAWSGFESEAALEMPKRQFSSVLDLDSGYPVAMLMKHPYRFGGGRKILILIYQSRDRCPHIVKPWIRGHFSPILGPAEGVDSEFHDPVSGQEHQGGETYPLEIIVMRRYALKEPVNIDIDRMASCGQHYRDIVPRELGAETLHLADPVLQVLLTHNCP